jgi:hypothetical protein
LDQLNSFLIPLQLFTLLKLNAFIHPCSLQHVNDLFIPFMEIIISIITELAKIELEELIELISIRNQWHQNNQTLFGIS